LPTALRAAWVALSLTGALPFRSPAAETPEKCYLFSYFLGNGEDGLHLAWSKDGYHWEPLNHGHSLLEPLVGEARLMRDPCLMRAPDGTFHMVWTTSWKGRTIGYASSRDLVHWSPQKALIVMGDEPAAMNCWAPEIAWDAHRQDFLIFWSTTITNRFLETAGQTEDHYNHRIYATTTRDFQSFTGTRLFYDPGFSVIDATLLPAEGHFYLVFKDETAHPPRKHLRMAVSDAEEGPYGPPGPAFTRAWVEGPSALRLGNEYIVYFDCYRDQLYGAVTSKDLVHWQDVSARVVMPAGAHHGTALEVPIAVLSPLLK
jgi:beta-xylosidase